MKMTPADIYRARKKFFNESAEKWIDMWYRAPETGEKNKHEADFKRLFDLMPLNPGDCVLDAGCGTGVLVPYLLNAIGNQGTVYELDFAESMIETNRTLHPDSRIHFIVSDVESAPLPENCCEVAVCFSCFPHFQDKPKAIRTIGRILKTRGFMVIAHFDSSEDINSHHKSCHAVMHDHLPAGNAMRAMIEDAGLSIGTFIDENRFYYVQAQKNSP